MMSTSTPRNEALLSVAYVTGGFEAGGAERELICQVKALQMRGHSVAVLTMGRDEPLEPEFKALGVPVLYVGDKSDRLRRAIAVNRQVRRIQPDIVHSQHFYTNIYARAATLATRAVSIGSLQNDFYSEIAGKGILGRMSYKLLPWMTGNSPIALERLQAAGYPGNRSFYLANALDLEQFDRSAAGAADMPSEWRSERRSEIVLVSVGNLKEQKRHDRLLRVLRKVVDREMPVRLLIVGSGELEGSLRRLADELGLGDHVRFLGRRMDVPALLAAADIFVLCSDHEGMPNVVQEAMGAGLPCVVSRVGAVPELVGEGEDGFLLDPHDEAGFADRIGRLVAGRELREKMGVSARRRAEMVFSLTSLGERLERIYSHVLGRIPHDREWLVQGRALNQTRLVSQD